MTDSVCKNVEPEKYKECAITHYTGFAENCSIGITNGHLQDTPDAYKKCVEDRILGEIETKRLNKEYIAQYYMSLTSSALVLLVSIFFGIRTGNPFGYILGFLPLLLVIMIYNNEEMMFFIGVSMMAGGIFLLPIITISYILALWNMKGVDTDITTTST